MIKRIETLAYEIYEKNGKVDGFALEHWVEAEQVVLAKYATPGDTEKKPAPSRKKNGKASA